MIKITGLCKSYSRKSDFAVEDLSLTVPDRSVTALLGTNGSGKTTVIKAVCGFHFPTKGRIILTDSSGAEHDVCANPERAMALAGFVPEIPSLPLSMIAGDFLRFAASTHGISGADAQSSVRRVIKECSLEDFVHKPVRNLSKGQRQRLSLAQALVHNPPNLILDEPMSGLDPAQIIGMRRLIERLAKSRAILMSTHIMQEVRSLCDNICIISGGKSVCTGSEGEIIARTRAANLEEAFLALSGGDDSDF